MNIANLKSLGTAFVLLGALSGCTGNQAPESTATTTAPATDVATPAAAPEPMATAEPAVEATAIPDSADAIWQAIDTHSTELKTTIASGSLGAVHHHAFAIRDLVAALPSHTPTLGAEDQAKLEGEVKFVNTLAERLDESGDAGDQAASQSNYDQLVAVLNGMTRYK